MNAQAILNECEVIGVSVSPLDNGKLWVDPGVKLTEELREAIVSNKPEILLYLHAKQRLHIHRVLVKMRDINPYRIGDTLKWRGNPSEEQQRLIQKYNAELIDALTPRALTPREAELIASWLDDIGETRKGEREAVFEQARNSPIDRVALVWIAEGSPESIS